MEFTGIYDFSLSERKKGKTSQMQASNGETKGLGMTASWEYGGWSECWPRATHALACGGFCKGKIEGF